LWSVPGGKLEYGENVAFAAARETLEEATIAAKAFDQTNPVAAVTEYIEMANDDAQWHYVLVHVPCVLDQAASADEQPVPVAADDAADAEWVLVDSLAQRQDLVDGLADTVARCRAMILGQERV
jgi:8-oxo-dGTP diphosphatase